MLSGFNQLKWRITYKGILAGLISGLLAVLYRLGIEFGTEKSIQAYRYLKVHPIFIAPWILFLIAAGFIVYWLTRLEPDAKGSGIPQVEGILLLGMKMKWYAILTVRFLAGFMGSLFGVSVGREGPSIQIGACGSQALAEKTGKNKLEENYLITAGASAGLSAAFNAPLSGIMFALEEIHRSFSPNILIAATAAALTSDCVSKYFFGLKPVLSYVGISQLPMQYYMWLPVLGILSGLVGGITNKGLLGAGTLYEKIPAVLRPILAFLIALPCGLFLPQILGGGQGLIKLSENGEIGIPLLITFLIAKLIFTCTSFGSGIPGGIFMPILAIGALTGRVFGQAVAVFGVPAEFIPAFCVCAMAGAMSGSVKAPVTSILLMAEMTGSLVHLLPVAVVSFVALLTSDILNISPIYEVLLDRMTGGNRTPVDRKGAGAIIEVPVEPGSKIAGKRVRDISWPEGTLIIGLSRGEKEFVPNGDTCVLHGDYLVALSSEQKYDEMNRRLTELCRPS